MIGHIKTRVSAPPCAVHAHVWLEGAPTLKHNCYKLKSERSDAVSRLHGLTWLLFFNVPESPIIIIPV